MGVVTETLKGPKPAVPVTSFWDIEGFLEDEKGAWYVEGYCSTFSEDLGGDVIDPEAAEYAKSQLVGLTLLFNHDIDEPIGSIVAARVDDHGIWIKALVSKTAPLRWEQIKDKTLKKFSIRLLELEKNPALREGRKVMVIMKMIITEVSLTSLPMNRGANAALAYEGKTLTQGGVDMGVEAALEVFTKAVDQLLEDVKSGQIQAVTEEGEPAQVQAPPTEEAKAEAVKSEEKAAGEKPGGEYYPEPPKGGALSKIVAQLQSVLTALEGMQKETKSLVGSVGSELEARVSALEAKIAEQAKSIPATIEEATKKVEDVATEVKALQNRLPEPTSKKLEEEEEKQKAAGKPQIVLQDRFRGCFPGSWSKLTTQRLEEGKS